MDVQMRASDDDRQRVVDDLQRHTTEGRLTLDEFTERIGVVYSARTLGELAEITRDLPAAPAPAAPGRNSRRELLGILAVAVVTLILLYVFMEITR